MTLEAATETPQTPSQSRGAAREAWKPASSGRRGKGRKADVAKNDHDPKGGLHDDAVQRSIFPSMGAYRSCPLGSILDGASGCVGVLNMRLGLCLA